MTDRITGQSFTSDAPDAVERWILLTLKILVYLWLTYFFYQAIVTFNEYTPGKHWPFMLSIFRTFTFLPIHEAGHVIFRFFGRTLNILGGSFWQIMFPLLWFIIAAKQQSHVAPFALFWVGENMMDVSLYMRDAPVRQLPLLGGHVSQHDWYNLFKDWNMLDSAETVADITFSLGIIISAAAIVAGLILAYRSFSAPRIKAFNSARDSVIEDSLDNLIEKNEKKPFL